MADINVERKGPSIWPWIVGLLVLALLIWAIAEMVDRDETDDVAIERVEPEVQAPAVPAPTPMAPEAQDFQALLPLGPEDQGQMVRLSGTVMGEPTQQGYWVRTEDDHVIFVRSSQQVQSGQQVQATGMLERSQPEQATNWTDQAQLAQTPGFQDLENVHRDMHISEQGAGAAQPGAQTQPGQTQPGQTQPGAP